ncbi:YbaB/EbfC family nucleoid-associated protein [Kitasatospora sp. NPDC093102]|uniref:YbaB/EbfC family nucleoid-associated protein n=1 Tax=Kitasatospora sp. NPDC093102 TaxID=3155069 RepID=UPI00341E12F0
MAEEEPKDAHRPPSLGGHGLANVMEIFVRNVTEQHKHMEESQEKLRQATGKATSPKRQLTVVCGPQGELKELTFHDTSYREMSKVELSKLIVDTVAKARTDVGAKVKEIVAPALPGRLDFDKLQRGEFDITDLIPDGVVPDETLDRINDRMAERKRNGLV